MISVQSLVISASMKQIVPLIAVKMWCWNPLRFHGGSSHLHGFHIEIQSGSAHSLRNHNKEEERKKVICIYFSFLFDLELGSNFKKNNSGCDLNLSWTVNWKWNVLGWSKTAVSLCFFNRSADAQDAISQNTLGQMKNTGSNVAIEMTSLWHPASFLYTEGPTGQSQRGK